MNVNIKKHPKYLKAGSTLTCCEQTEPGPLLIRRKILHQSLPADRVYCPFVNKFSLYLYDTVNRRVSPKNGSKLGERDPRVWQGGWPGSEPPISAGTELVCRCRNPLRSGETVVYFFSPTRIPKAPPSPCDDLPGERAFCVFIGR